MARAHPYHFVHVLLPQLAWRRPEAVRRELSDPALARDLLHYVWDKAADGLPSADKVPPRGLRLSWHEVAGRVTALVQLPAPQATSEAHFAALVYEEIESPDDADAPEIRPRYFTLEAALGLCTGEGTPTVVGERDGDAYRQLGRGPNGGQPDTAAAFLRALADVLGPLPDLDVPYMHVVRS